MLVSDTPRRRIAQFNKPFTCARCGEVGLAATAKKKYCGPCKIALSIEMSEERRRAAVKAAGRAYGQPLLCSDCGCRVSRTSSNQTRCRPCSLEARKVYEREWMQRKNGTTVALGSVISCSGCGSSIIKNGGKQKFCTVCRRNSQRKIDREIYRTGRGKPVAIIGAEIACEICGVCFIRTGAQHKYCGDCQPEAKNALARVTMARRRKVPKHKLNLVISSAICRSIKSGAKGGRRWQEIVGFTFEDLVSHLSAQFLLGMTLGNHGEWHIDHIRPLCSFEFQTPDDPQFREAWALSNLQPLWAKDNLSKGGRWEPLAA